MSKKTSGGVTATVRQNPILPPPVKRTQHMTVMAQIKSVATVVGITDQWANALGQGAYIRSRGAVTRKQLTASRQSTLPLAINPPSQMAEQIDVAVKTYGTNAHEVLAWCVNRGAQDLSVQGLIEAFPGRTPSFSLAGVLALSIGLSVMSAEFQPATKAADGSTVGGRVNGGKWSKRKPKENSKRKKTAVSV